MTSIPSQFAKGNSALLDGNFEEAIKLYKIALKDTPVSPELESSILFNIKFAQRRIRQTQNCLDTALGFASVQSQMPIDHLVKIPHTGAVSDHALVVHVFHLDVLDELALAAANLPQSTDQYVTLPSQFGTAEREQIAVAFPRARQIIVENVGQDVGALFQLMKQVDLGRYDFICKIHTKKGPNMPNEWRRALLDGVLGSERQVRHIIERFRVDPLVMMAGAREMYLHGPTFLYKNEGNLLKSFGELIGNFDLRRSDWGFIGGTFFWIRTSILTDIAGCNLDFQPSGYIDDGLLAHAVERMFGLCVTLRAGKILLQCLALPERLPDQELGFPGSLPHTKVCHMLSTLAAHMFLKKPSMMFCSSGCSQPPSPRKRVAVFASYSADGVLPAQVVPYLEGLKSIATIIVVVCDNDLLPSDERTLHKHATHVITGRHSEYDFGSYKRGFAWLRQSGHLDHADDLILCNDSCFGPIGSFSPMFAEMDVKNLDLWGVTDSREFSYHLQSYFLVLTRKVFTSTSFISFIEGVTKQENVQQVIMNYELGLTKTLKDAGFAVGALVNYLKTAEDPTYSNLSILPFYTISRGSPLLKVKAMKSPYTNLDGVNRILNWLEVHDQKLYAVVASDLDMKRFSLADTIAFSLVLPTRNRAHYIGRAVRSVLAQSHRKFELIIIDDGSTDNTGELVRDGFSDALASGHIRYIKLDKPVGVCAARNIGLAFARNSWIGYVDDDNEIRPYMLTIYANTIVQNPSRDAFYSRIFKKTAKTEIGMPFNRSKLVEGNFIDLNGYVHNKSLVHRFGGFDESLKRLVDWDMILRHTKEKDPFFIPRVCVDYDDDKTSVDRISVRESVVKALTAVRSKHSPKPTVSTLIVSYNHESFITDAIESALAQRGDFNHEIVLADDGSTDGTPQIIAKYVEKYPSKVRSISRGENFGVSENYRHSFHEAEGQFIAVLEGDDYWTDPEKNFKLATFLTQNKDASMVFSRIELFDMRNNSRRLLSRQEGLPNMLSAADFAANEHLNLICNLSSCMFRSDIMKRLPDTLRLNEIALAFYLDRLGGIGFLSEVMSTYRMNNQSVWTGADMASKHQQAIDVRESALRIARPIYRATIQEHIDRRRHMLAEELAKNPRAVAVA